MDNGDRNTQYYHLKTVSRRRKNNVMMLRSEDGQWIEDTDQLHDLVSNFYQNLFKYAHTNEEWCQTDYTFPSLRKDILEELVSPITNAEVKCALLIVNSWNALGPNGLHAVKTGQWKTLRAGRESPVVSHLMFVDDMLQFGEASEGQMICVMFLINFVPYQNR
ncbi:RNA-directed DNA polymerase (Reverse transcriptase), partial [Trifolium medium]|nr:RNA-directed DNA polymerase (Reverse transcriptase) [Trifolium medium]